MILDEPTIAQDVSGRRMMGEIIRKLRKENLLSLHDMDFVAEYFERVVIMAKGKILTDGTQMKHFHRTKP